MRRPSACGSRSSDSARLNPRSRGRRRRRADRTAAADGPAEADLPAARAAAADVAEAVRAGTHGVQAAPDGAFELLSSADGGVSWNELPPPAFDVLIRQRSILPYPVGIAAAAQQEIVLFGGIDRTGQSWRDAWRWAQ